MFDVLNYILQALQWLADNIVAVIQSGVVDFVNGLFLAISEFLTLLFGLLPSLPAVPTISGSFLGWLNWLLPVGDLLAGMGALIAIFLSFLVIRYMLNLVRAL